MPPVKDPLVHTVAKSLSAKECKTIIDMFENDETRNGSNMLAITVNPAWSETDTLLFSKLKDALNDYEKMLNETMNTRLLSQCAIKDTGYLIRKFPATTGKYDWQQDTTSHQNRVLTYMWFINDVKEGGEVVFKSCKPIKPKAGTLLIFPCTWNFFHSGTDALSNDKYIITGHVYIHPAPPQSVEPSAA